MKKKITDAVSKVESWLDERSERPHIDRKEAKEIWQASFALGREIARSAPGA